MNQALNILLSSHGLHQPLPHWHLQDINKFKQRTHTKEKKHMSAGKMLPVELAARALVSSPTPAKVNSLQWAKQENVVRRIGGLALL